MADIERAHAIGRIALIACIEAAAPIENELDRLDILYGLGVRMIGVAYSESNQLGLWHPRSGRRGAHGLRPPGGHEDEPPRHGDRPVRTPPDLTALQTCERSSAPVFLSHSGARALYPEKKLKTDELLRAVAATGGVIGIEASPNTTALAGHRAESRDRHGRTRRTAST